jgi:hypothetical protein
MGKKRVIDMDSFCFDVDVVKTLGYKGSILYIRLWSIAEDFGGYDPDYDSIALRMGAFKLKPKEIKSFISGLIKIGKIVEYEVDGKTYHWIKQFLKRQILNNPAPPQNIPVPSWIGFEIKRFKSGKKYAIYSVISETIPVGYQSDTGKSETTGKETKGKEIETTRKVETLTEIQVQRFELFWNAFDYKSGKEPAKKVWAKIKMDDDIFNRIIISAKTEAHNRAAIKAKQGTPKMAQGWLTDERYNDEALYQPEQATGKHSELEKC